MENPGSWSFETAARTAWQEARGEPDDGLKAVCHVLVNRLKDGRWGRTLAAVCLSPLQFSGWNAHDPNRMAAANLGDQDPNLARCRKFLEDALAGEPDPTNGAMWYYATSIAEPEWAKTAVSCGQFGHQLFYKGVH